MDQLNEFISSEEAYVETLRTIVSVIARQLQPQNILNQFKFSHIFLNIEQILEANERFLAELKRPDVRFGEVCAEHMANFECYRKYSLEYKEAQRLHAKEFKNNQAYRSFLIKAKDDPRCKRRQLQDLLVQPPQRISRYTMLFKDILRFTPSTHRDFDGLQRALVKASEIATLDDDDPTKVAIMCHNLFTSVKDSPASLINQSRSFIAYLDATEIHRETNKPRQAVTLFLFNDRLMIANRPSHQCRGIDLCGGGEDNLPSSGSLMRTIKKDQSLKFKGWIEIEQIELFQGAADRPGSFLLRTLPNKDPNGDRYSKYFHKGPRLYGVIPPKESDELDTLDHYVNSAQQFHSAFRHAQALTRQSHETYYREWKDMDVYSNMYNTDTYAQAPHKNNIAVVYLEDEDPEQLDVRLLFGGGGASAMTPWAVALVQGDSRGFRLTFCSRVPRSRGRPSDANPTVDFESILWNNVILCERHIRTSDAFSRAVDGEERRPRSRTRSLSRSSSIPTLSKIFSGSRSRSTSPSRRLSEAPQVVPTASRSSPILQTKKDLLSFARRTSLDKKQRPRSQSMTSTLAAHDFAQTKTTDAVKRTPTRKAVSSVNLVQSPVSLDVSLEEPIIQKERRSSASRSPTNGSLKKNRRGHGSFSSTSSGEQTGPTVFL
ncbi:hypothetical protein BCR43DRAFT_255363 [Syncephalastrum racemosum]|uniref:DH domain-containing protein n=1 Tax=Syncephalastrum racemosum TaxID=13706 RepID=A0A1X2HG40_SYNRA|nr:hypothetical protein BCR43DRAFT_255363 [Syncephalastrum racemosum]